MDKQLSKPKQTREFLSNLFSEWWPLSFPRFMKKANKLIANVEIFHNKLESRTLACQSRSKSIPKNATIRNEFVKCTKPNCRRKLHGPYYYAYWKDPETKKLKKKYIGRNYLPNGEQKKQEREKE